MISDMDGTTTLGLGGATVTCFRMMSSMDEFAEKSSANGGEGPCGVAGLEEGVRGDDDLCVRRLFLGVLGGWSSSSSDWDEELG